MKLKFSKNWKHMTAFVLVLCMLMSVLGSVLPPSTVEAGSNDAVSYTVTLGEDSNYFLSNNTATSGPVKLTYTVESATFNNSINGVVASTAPDAAYPYDGTQGSMTYTQNRNRCLLENRTYTMTLNLDANGKINPAISVLNHADNSTADIKNDLQFTAGSGNAESQYFGIYIANVTAAKLVNVTCTDAQGNDLGLRVQSSKTNYTIESNQPAEPDEPEESISYTVTLGEDTNYFLSNKTATSGPVKLTYTVESATFDNSINGVVASTAPDAAYPYDGTQGSMTYTQNRNRCLLENRTYTMTLSLDANGKISPAISVLNHADNSTADIKNDLQFTAGSGNAESQYFGIYIANVTAAKLVNVTCTDAQGNDLGLRVQSSKTNYTIESNQPAEPDEPEESISYTVTLGEDTNYFLSNKTATSGPVTLTYTVESATFDNSINGVVASTAPDAAYPYDGTQGSMTYTQNRNRCLLENRTYTMTLSLDANGKISPAISVLNHADNSTADIKNDLQFTAGSGNAESQYFGIYIANVTAAKLVNVTCTDAQGNDLGLRVQSSKTNYTIVSNQEPENPDNPENPETPEDEGGYTVVLNGDSNYFISNNTPTTGPVTLTYTVESSAADGVIVNGVVATAKPDTEYPYDGDQGSMKYRQDRNDVLIGGYRYSITMSLDANGKISFNATYNNGTNSGVLNIPHSAGNGNTSSQYFGIYISRVTAAKLVHVTCTDAAGNDLGVRVNKKSCVITSPDEGLDYIDPNTDLPSEFTTEQTLNPDFRLATVGTFNVEEGVYENSKASGLYALSMHKLIFSAEVKFSEAGFSDIRYAGAGTGYGLAFGTEGDNLTMKDVSGKTGIYLFDPAVAGVDFTDNQFNLKISTEYVDRDSDGTKDDVKLGVWFNDKLYANKYIYLCDYQLGKYITVQSLGEGAYLDVRNTKGIAIGVDYTIFGYTSNWMKELGIIK